VEVYKTVQTAVFCARRMAQQTARRNVRDRKAGLGRVLFTSSLFQEFGSGEFESFDRRALLVCRT